MWIGDSKIDFRIELFGISGLIDDGEILLDSFTFQIFEFLYKLLIRFHKGQYIKYINK